jgi:hypothetical protein
MVEVVDGPRREQLPQGHLAERWMQAAAVQVGVDGQFLEGGQACATERREALHQVVERDTRVALEHGEAVESVERKRCPLFEDPPRSWDPIGLLARDEVPDDIARAPAVGRVRRVGPLLGQADEERAEHVRGTRKQR